jgi:hypothetical protein
MDDWDAVSNTALPNDATDPWDAVSTPLSSESPAASYPVDPPTNSPRQSISPDTLTAGQQDAKVNHSSLPNQGAFGLSPTRRVYIPAPLLRKTLLFLAIILLLLAGGLGLARFETTKVNVVAFTPAQASATAIAGTNATATAETNATAVAQDVANGATTAQAVKLQQIYTQATSGTPSIDDPLSNNNMGYAWGVLTTSWEGACWFTGKDYHIAISNSGYYWLWCAGRNIYLNNFAFQVQESMAKPGDAGIVFGYTADGFYRMDIGSAGTFTLYQYTQNNKQTQTLISGTSSAINSGLNQANVITLIVNNGNLYFYVNNQFVIGGDLNAYGLSYQPGTFGFAAQNFGQPVEVVYTNLKVWTL